MEKNAQIKPKRLYLRWMLGICLLLVMLGAGLVFFWSYLPYQNAAAWQIRRSLEGLGLEVSNLSVEELTQSQTVLNDIELGDDHLLKIKRVVAQYNLSEVRHGTLRNLQIEGAEMELYQTGKEWRVGGLEPLMTSSGSSGSSNIAFDSERLKTLLPPTISFKNSTLNIKGSDASGSMPIEGTMSTVDGIVIKVSSKGAVITSDPYGVTTGSLQAAATLSKGAWRGTIKSVDLRVQGVKVDVPPLSMGGNFTAAPDLFTSLIGLKDSTATHKMDITFQMPIGSTKPGSMLIRKLQFPWSEGVIHTESVIIPLGEKKPISFALKFDNLQMAKMLDEIAQGKVQGTGKVSGGVPVTYYPDGRITLQNGNAEGQEEGVITVSPDILPGEDRKELETLKAALQNFHYTVLKIQLSSDQEQKTAIRLSLEGRNPEALGGRQVKLNVNFTGDVIPLIQQSLLPFTNPEALIHSQEKP